MCVTHNNIARGDSLIAFALTISESLVKITLSHFQFYIFAKEIVLFFLFSMAVVISHIGNVAVLSSGKNGLFLTRFFFQIFFTLGSRITFFRLTYFRKRYVFKKEIIYLFYVCLFFFERKFLLSLFFCKKYNQKLGGEKEIREIERKMEK